MSKHISTFVYRPYYSKAKNGRTLNRSLTIPILKAPTVLILISEGIQCQCTCSHKWFRQNLFGWLPRRRQCPRISISSIQSVKVAAEVEDRGTGDGALVRGWSSGSQPAPVGGGHWRSRCAKKWVFVKLITCQYGALDISWNMDFDFQKYW